MKEAWVGYISASAKDVKSRRVRAMKIDDVPAIRALFKQVFRPRSASCNENFDRYFQQLFFENPYYDPAIGSVVHENEHGEIDSAVSILPVPYTVGGRSIMGRLLCAFMMKPGVAPRGPAELTLALRPGEETIQFSDSAAPVSLRHFEAVGGISLTTYALGWTRIFMPASYAANLIAQRRPILGKWGAASVGRMLNPLFPLPQVSSVGKSRAAVKEIAQDEAVSLVPGLLQSYAAHPAWTGQDLNWLLSMAADNRAAGTLRLLSIEDQAGLPKGLCCYYSQSNGVAEVLNVIARSGTEKQAVDAMLLHFQDKGYVAAQGRVEPRYLAALSQQPAMFFRHRANVCIGTTRAEFLSAAQRDDIFIGGLAGEGWSRLSTDFF
ncbi:hypothetical protein [Mesorhizobium amorphae]|uniref:hypothetical protein n=1 Tax=Mesorhizobium amorphae TaxID=71433 RepID=UPI0021B35CFE|nr:hypothetical protein [Mesorhizobium amorphae]